MDEGACGAVGVILQVMVMVETAEDKGKEQDGDQAK
jgi:hypothetical protein